MSSPQVRRNVEPYPHLSRRRFYAPASFAPMKPPAAPAFSGFQREQGKQKHKPPHLALTANVGLLSRDLRALFLSVPVQIGFERLKRQV
ncbi:hypothetical protein [Caballeronia terrestris]|uniref:hypothetical protein n=1 Tax=Caballeronia terrestris TaxID=1226301 RepID=UPI000F73FE84|nr:hypothetical protein [Caballeronia terrestris]